MHAREFSFGPNEATVAAGVDVAVTLDNKGSIPHNWVILEEGVSVRSESDFNGAAVAGAVAAIDAGATGGARGRALR